MNKLKLFIWTNYSPDYTGGLAFAIAETESEARQLITSARGYEPHEWGDLEVLEVGKVAREVSGGS